MGDNKIMLGGWHAQEVSNAYVDYTCFFHISQNRIGVWTLYRCRIYTEIFTVNCSKILHSLTLWVIYRNVLNQSYWFKTDTTFKSALGIGSCQTFMTNPW